MPGRPSFNWGRFRPSPSRPPNRSSPCTPPRTPSLQWRRAARAATCRCATPPPAPRGFGAPPSRAPSRRRRIRTPPPCSICSHICRTGAAGRKRVAAGRERSDGDATVVRPACRSCLHACHADPWVEISGVWWVSWVGWKQVGCQACTQAVSCLNLILPATPLFPPARSASDPPNGARRSSSACVTACCSSCRCPAWGGEGALDLAC